MKRIRTILLTVILLLTCSTNIYSVYSDETQETYNNVLSENILKNYISSTAIEWAKSVHPELELEIGSIDKVYTEDNQNEYAVSYLNNNCPYGYAILCECNNDIVVKEANLTNGQKDLYSHIVETYDNDKGISINKNNKLIEIAPMQYGICAKKNNTDIIVDNYGNKINPNDITVRDSYNNSSSIFIKSKNWVSSKYRVDSSSRIILKKFQKRPKLISSQNTIKNTKKYACGVQALTQIAYMENLTSYSKSDLIKTYNKLWKDTNVSSTYVENNVTLGGNSMNSLTKGFVKYAKDLGYKGTKNKGIKNNPSIAWIKDKLKYNRPILMSYDIDVNGQIRGHAISVLGYMKATKVSSLKTYNYLMVYDSRNDSECYLNYTTVDFKSCSATYFWVKK